jgi:hypothetical protein
MSEKTTLMQYLREQLPEYEVNRNGSIVIFMIKSKRTPLDYNILEMAYIKGELTKENLIELLK